MASVLDLNEEETTHIKALYRATGISNRYSVLPDYNSTGKGLLFTDCTTLEPQPDTVARNRFYLKEAPLLAAKAAVKVLTEKSRQSVTHLITVSCTGIGAPGPDIELVKLLQLPRDVHRLAINFMGCYAAITALKQAKAICEADKDAKVLVVALELCTLHFQKTKLPDLLMANALFADGAAAVVVEANPMESGLHLELQDFYCDLLPEGEGDMSWMPGHFGFDMRLSTYIPDLIQGGMHQLLKRVELAFELSPTLPLYYALHPGGKKILQVLQQLLNVDKEALSHSYSVLRQHGNMSSPTVLFVLESLLMELKTKAVEKGKVLSLAFGPGLTVESALFGVKQKG